MNTFIKLFLAVVLTTLIFLVIIDSYLQRSLFNKVFIIKKDCNWTPDKYEDVFLYHNKEDTGSYFFNRSVNNPTERIRGWWMENNPNNPSILFFHGSANNIGDSKHMFDMASVFNYNLFTIEYRGFGLSAITKKGDILKDGELAYKWLRNKIGKDGKIYIFGESLGTAVAVDVASKYPCDKLILGAPFSSLGDVAKYQEGILTSIFSKIISRFYELFPSKNKIIDVSCPVLLIHSEQDARVPVRCSRVLYKKIKNENKKLLIIKGTHDKPIFSLENIYEMLEFFEIEGTEEIATKILEIFETRNDRNM